MTRFILTLLLLSALRCFASFTNVVGLEIETNGWVLRATIGGDASGSIGTNGNFFNGFATNNTLTATNALTLTLTSMGFDDTASGVQVSRTLYGTHILRLAYPLQNTNDITAQDAANTNVVFRIALSEFVYSRDSNITATALGGWLSGTNGNATNVAACSAVTVTNSSTQVYPKPIANWSQVPYKRISTNAVDNTYTVRAMAFHAYGQQGRSVRVIKFWGTDGTHFTPTNSQTVAVVDRAQPDLVPVTEYVASLYYTNLTQGSTITNYFAAYPWVGDTALDASDGAHKCPYPIYCPLELLCDKTGAYGVSFALVDNNATGGPAGLVVSNTFNAASPPAAFSNINAAAAALAASNNVWFSHNDVGGSTIYLTNGQYAWTGASAGVGNRPKTYVTLAAYPGTNATSVEIFRAAGSTDIKHLCAFTNISITSTSIASGTTCFQLGDALWYDHCTFNTTNKALWNLATNCYLTYCNIADCDQGLGAFSTGNTSHNLVRGCILNLGNTARIVPYTFIGNTRTATNSRGGGPFWGEVTAGGTQPNNDGAIVAYNTLYFLNTSGGGTFKIATVTNAATIGVVLSHNVLEGLTNTANGLFQVGPTATTGYGKTNVLIENNVMMGDKTQIFYDDPGSVTTFPRYSYQCFLRNNIFDNHNIKSDASQPSPTALRIGNWPALYSVGCSGNVDLETVNIGAAAAFPPEFNGMNTFRPIAPNTSATTLSQFFTLGSCPGTAMGAGGGYYRLLASSPWLTFNIPSVVPFDIGGVPRGSNDPPGAYIFYGGAPLRITGSGRITGRGRMK